MTMADITIYDAATGVVTVRDFTPEEAAQRALDEAQALADAQTRALTDGNWTTLTDRAVTALQGNRDFLALASPTNAQTLAQVKNLTRQNTALIRLMLGLLDGTD
jgi:hypothetical protein